MCLEPENDACGLRWCPGLQMSFLTRRPAGFGLVVVQRLASMPVVVYWKFSLKLVRGFSWRTPGEHFHLEKENSALFCKAQGISFLNTALWNLSWWVPASEKHRHLVMFAATLFVCSISVLIGAFQIPQLLWGALSLPIWLLNFTSCNVGHVYLAADLIKVFHRGEFCLICGKNRGFVFD